MNLQRPPSLAIMGIRGVPARHGGFETFAARLAPHLAARGWRVSVYCQEDAREPLRTTEWEGVRRVHIGVGPDTAFNSVRFDWACVRHAVRERPPLVLTLGYNTAAFGIALRAAGIRNVINMDGIEWSRSKWGPAARTWLYFNEWAGSLLGNHLLADHPEIARHLSRRVRPAKITTIPYGTDADAAPPTPEHAAAEAALLAPLGVQPGGYVTLIARPEPENSVLEMVRAFSARPRGLRLVVLGAYYPDKVPYHARVQAEASAEVLFPGGVYDPSTVNALRRHGLLYLHGHRVGGTNPSLLEAMGAGNAVLAHDNRFNRWVAGDGARYFTDTAACTAALDALLADAPLRARLAEANRRRAAAEFSWAASLERYEATLSAQLPACETAAAAPARPPTRASAVDPGIKP